MQKISIVADGIYLNPNPYNLTVDSWKINVTANDVDVANVDLVIPTKIPANDEFIIPIIISFPPSQALNLESGLLGGIINAIQTKEVELVYKGTIIMNVMGIPVPVTVDEIENVPIKFR